MDEHTDGTNTRPPRRWARWLALVCSIVALGLAAVALVVALSVEGDPGPTGPQGAEGPTGAAGPPGVTTCEIDRYEWTDFADAVEEYVEDPTSRITYSNATSYPPEVRC